MSALIGVAIFFLALTLDVLVAAYYRALATGRCLRTGGLAMAISAVGTISAYVVIRDSTWFMVPELAGVGIGGALGCYLGRPRD